MNTFRHALPQLSDHHDGIELPSFAAFVLLTTTSARR
jgi:hypothetical protein